MFRVIQRTDDTGWCSPGTRLELAEYKVAPAPVGKKTSAGVEMHNIGAWHDAGDSDAGNLGGIGLMYGYEMEVGAGAQMAARRW